MKKKISDEKVMQATGKGWEEWFKILSKFNKDKWSHKEAVKQLQSTYKVSYWWSQAVVREFEIEYDLKKIGQTEDVGFQIGVRKTIPISKERIWDYITSEEGVKIWLGKVKEIDFKEGYKYQFLNGLKGKIKVVKQHDKIRLTWKKESWEKASTIQLRLLSKGEGKTIISFHQENLPDENARKEMSKYWREVISVIEKNA